MIDIGCSSSSWRQAGLCGAALGIMPLEGRRGETGKKGELQGVLTVHLGKKKIGQKTPQVLFLAPPKRPFWVFLAILGVPKRALGVPESKF